MGPPRTDPKQKKKKGPRSEEERIAGRILYLQRLKDKVLKKESQQLKLLTKVSKKAKDLEIRKLKRRLAVVAKIESGELEPRAEEEARSEDESGTDPDEDNEGNEEAGTVKKKAKFEKVDRETLERQLAAAKRLNHQSIAVLVSKKMEFETTKEEQPEVDNSPPAEGPDPAVEVVVDRVLKARIIASQMEEAKGVIADAKKLIERYEIRRQKSAARHERRKAKAVEKAERIAQGLEPLEPEVKPVVKTKKQKSLEKKEAKKKRDRNSWSSKRRAIMGKLLMGKAKYSKEGRMEAKRLAQEMLSRQGYAPPPPQPPQQGSKSQQKKQMKQAQPGGKPGEQKQLEELHPSWAAKKRQSGMLGDLPTQGAAKKVVFDD